MKKWTISLFCWLAALIPLSQPENLENQDSFFDNAEHNKDGWPTLPPEWTAWTPGGPFPSMPPDVTLPPIFTKGAKVEIPDLGEIQGVVGKTSPYFGWFTDQPKIMYMFAGIPFADPKSYTGKDNRFKPSKIWPAGKPLRDDGKPFNALNPIIWCPQNDILQFDTENLNLDPGETLKAYSRKDQVARERKANGTSELITPQVQGTEECLVINIHTRKIPKDPDTEELLPVILYIHGGSFEGLFGGVFGGQRFLNREVVFIAINYRLGILGSLNLNIDDAPGNAAMYDVVTAIDWIKKYIKYFGGDPNRLTVSGQSAGAVLASHLLTSPLMKERGGRPKIQGLLPISGSSLSKWATSENPLPHHLKVAFNAGCYDKTVSEENLTPANLKQIRDCMADSSTAVLIEAAQKYTASERKAGGLGLAALVPSVQSEKLTIDRFMEDSPYNVMKQQRQLNIPLMTGTTRHDGTFVARWTYYDFLLANNYHNDSDFLRNEFIAHFLKSALELSDDSGEMIHSMTKLYVGDAIYTDDFESKIPGFVDIHSVLGFKSGAYQLIEMHSKVNPNSFYFSFDYSGFWTMDNNDPVIPGGVGHIDVAFYLFQLFPLFVPKDREVAKRFTDYWMNFVIHGDPNGLAKKQIAPPYNPINHAHLVIDAKDYTGFYVRDGWINNSLEIMRRKKDPLTTTSEPLEEILTTTPDAGSTLSFSLFSAAPAILIFLTTHFFNRVAFV